MNKICWKGRAFKALSYGKNCKKAGRNFSGSITIFHRGGGSKKLLRRIDFQRKNLARFGRIERIEYDPNRTARIALVRWSNIKLNDSVDNDPDVPLRKGPLALKPPSRIEFSSEYSSGSNFRRPGVETILADPLSNQHGRRTLPPLGRGRFTSGEETATHGRCFPGGPRHPTQKVLASAGGLLTDLRLLASGGAGVTPENWSQHIQGRLPRPQQGSAWNHLNFPPRLLFANGAKRKWSPFFSYSQFEQEQSWRTSLSGGGPTAKSANEGRPVASNNIEKAQQHSIEFGLPIERAESAFSYIIASQELKSGDEILNIDTRSARINRINRLSGNRINRVSRISSQTKILAQLSDRDVEPAHSAGAHEKDAEGSTPAIQLDSPMEATSGERAFGTRLGMQAPKRYPNADVRHQTQTPSGGLWHANEDSHFFKRVTVEPAALGPLDNVEHLYQKSGNSLPLWLAPIGSVLHNIELYPGAGGKLARAAGTSAQLVQKPLMPSSLHRGAPAHKEGPSKEGAGLTPLLAKAFEGGLSRSTELEHAEPHVFTRGPSGTSDLRILRRSSLCTVRLPSGQQQLLDLRCRATIGCVSNIDHRSRTLRKAGQSRWLGFRPVVRGVAMNPIDHPHGGGSGRTKGGRPSVSPWGKPAKRARRSKSSPRGAMQAT